MVFFKILAAVELRRKPCFFHDFIQIFLAVRLIPVNHKLGMRAATKLVQSMPMRSPSPSKRKGTKRKETAFSPQLLAFTLRSYTLAFHHQSSTNEPALIGVVRLAALQESELEAES